jgi:hypothetical protein
MNTIFILTIILGIIPVAAVWLGADSRDLQHRDLRSLVT